MSSGPGIPLPLETGLYPFAFLWGVSLKDKALSHLPNTWTPVVHSTAAPEGRQFLQILCFQSPHLWPLLSVLPAVLVAGNSRAVTTLTIDYCSCVCKFCWRKSRGVKSGVPTPAGAQVFQARELTLWLYLGGGSCGRDFSCRCVVVTWFSQSHCSVLGLYDFFCITCHEHTHPPALNTGKAVQSSWTLEGQVIIGLLKPI